MTTQDGFRFWHSSVMFPGPCICTVPISTKAGPPFCSASGFCAASSSPTFPFFLYPGPHSAQQTSLLFTKPPSQMSILYSCCHPPSAVVCVWSPDSVQGWPQPLLALAQGLLSRSLETHGYRVPVFLPLNI